MERQYMCSQIQRLLSTEENPSIPIPNFRDWGNDWLLGQVPALAWTRGILLSSRKTGSRMLLCVHVVGVICIWIRYWIGWYRKTRFWVSKKLLKVKEVPNCIYSKISVISLKSIPSHNLNDNMNPLVNHYSPLILCTKEGNNTIVTIWVSIILRK